MFQDKYNGHTIVEQKTYFHCFLIILMMSIPSLTPPAIPPPPNTAPTPQTQNVMLE